jgi:hypothetical protein
MAPPGRPRPPSTKLLVVGVARDFGYDVAGVIRDGGPPRPIMFGTVYVPLSQRYDPRLLVVARSTGGQRLAAELRAAVAAQDANLPILDSRTLDDRLLGPDQIQLRIAASVAGSLGVVGLLLASIGIYGVTAYAVTRRTREIGIRLAMGARHRDVVAMILRQGMSLVVTGVAIGLILGAGVARVLAGSLPGIPVLDPLSFGGAAALFLAIGLLACYLPVRRAGRIGALESLRYE